MTRLLPPSSTPLEHALAGVSERLDALPVIYRDLWNPDTCPLEFLPYLAWSFSVDEWDDAWPEHIKRQTVKDSLYQHRIKGSRQSVDNAIAAFNAQARIIEWWEKTPNGTPHTFEVWLNAIQNEQSKPVLEISTGDDAWVFCSAPIPVNTSRVYKVRFKVRQTVDDDAGSQVYAGVATLDADFNLLTGGPGFHRYCAQSGKILTTDDDWQIFEGEITGEGNDSHNQFRQGTAYIRPMFIVNCNGGKGTAQVAELECWDLFDNKQLVPNPHFKNGKSGWSTHYTKESVPDNAPGNLTTESFGLTADLQRSIIAAIRAVKPLRSHFTVNTGVSSTGTINAVGVSRLINHRRLEMTV